MAGPTAAGRRGIVLRGEAAAPGIAVARTVLFERLVVPVFRLAIPRRETAREIRRFQQAIADADRQLGRIRDSTREALGKDHAYLFEGQRLMLQDPLLVDRVRAEIRERQVNAEWALRTVIRELEGVFDGLADEYLRQRKGEIADVGGRLLQNLAGRARPAPERGDRKQVVAAEDLRPSDTAELDWSRTLGIVMEAGGPTYHTAILARTHDVPCVTGVRGLLRHIRIGSPIVVDGTEGVVVVGPSRDTLREYRRRRLRARERRRRLVAATAGRAVTADGEPVSVLANIDEPGELAAARENGAEGVGLFRTEALAAAEIPGEEEQVRIYRELAGALHPHPLVVRAFDLDATRVGRQPELNPALGLRGTRLLAQASGVFETQIRAVLRAATEGTVLFMFPMVGGIEEFRTARTHVGAAKRALRRRGTPFREVPLGAMIEVPSAAATADVLAAEADFLSVGTNDLMQYLFGADRANERVAQFNDPLHPAILRTIRFTARVAARNRTPITVCGEMAADPLALPLLIGFGVRSFSLTPHAVPEVKRIIGKVHAGEAAELARAAVHLTTARRVRARLLRGSGARRPSAAAPLPPARPPGDSPAAG